MDDDRSTGDSDRIEERLSALEAAVEEIRDNLLHVAILARGMPQGHPSPPTTSPEKARRAATASHVSAETPTRRPRDLEKWLGQNGLLVVGVLALIAAVGYTLKYAFDQGWVSPAARVLAGLVAGIAVAAYGERLIRQGLGRFGAGLQGAGASIAYLAIWAAAGPYEFIPPIAGIAVLAVVAGVVMLSALRHDEPYLAGLAAIGAYLAPVLLGEGSASGNVLLAYSVVVTAAAGAVAVMRGWRPTYLAAVLGYGLMAIMAAGADADDAVWGLYITLGGGALLGAALWRNWVLEATLAWFCGWGLVVIPAQWIDGWRAWVFVLGPAALAWPMWKSALDVAPGSGARLHAGDAGGTLWTAMFYATAVGWAFAATEALPAPADMYPLVVAIFIALVFLAPGLLRGNAAMHLAGLGALAIGITAQWDWLGSAAGFAVLALLAAVTTRSAPLAENRWTGSVLAAMAAYALFGANEQSRPSDDPALIGRWAGVLYLVTASTVAIAGPLWTRTEERWEAPGGLKLRTVTWLLAALVALVGGTIEIPAFVTERGGSELAAGLAVSVYWLLFAGGLLAYGFSKDSRAVRITGLSVAALAIGKVLFVDLAELQALYRVGSLALLAVIALVSARAYHRRE